MPINQNDLFPHIHPLNRGLAVDQIIEAYPFLNDWRKSFVNHYGYILDKDYLNEEKMNGAIRFLITKFKQDDIIDSIKNLTDAYGTTLFKKSKRRQLEQQDISLFWAFETGAFIVINRAITERAPERYFLLIDRCFLYAGNYKEVWNERERLRLGGIGRHKKFDDIKKILYEKWLSYPWNKRRQKAFITASDLDNDESLYKPNHQHPKFSTIINWVREWKKALKQIDKP